MPITEAAGRVLASPIHARVSHPMADVSSMDGYALRAGDPGDTRRVAGTAPAGAPYPHPLQPGEAIQLFTGSLIPAGADAVIAQEDVIRAGDTIRGQPMPGAGQFIRRQGQDFAAGDLLLVAGARLTSRALGLAAAANHPWLAVHRRPVVGILCTGAEVAMPGEPLPPGGLPNANAALLAGLVAQAGGIPRVLPIAPDDPGAIAAAASDPADLLLTTGGASVGAHDAIRPGLEAAGFAIDFWRIAMRPGRPMLAGRRGPTLALGLPGNPVSAFVCALLFALPAIRRLAGDPRPAPPRRAARLGAALPACDARMDFIRATLEGDVATPFPRQDSALLRFLAAADCLIVRAPHAAAAAAGDGCETVLFDFC